MIHAYESELLERAQNNMGDMLDFADRGLGIALPDYYERFLQSPYSLRFARGDYQTITGMSGVELALCVLGVNNPDREVLNRYMVDSVEGRSVLYWTGWALAYYQWETSFSFQDIHNVMPISEISKLYHTYHEMDIRQFCDYMTAQYRKVNTDSALKRKRTELGFSQKELADMADIPLKTIQQYEQRRKDINHARVDYLVNLSRCLHCNIEMLLEKV